MPGAMNCRCRWTCFNPRPPVRAGDAWCPGMWQRPAGCFNPRPPVRVGDAQDRVVLRVQLGVSIRARR